MPTSNVWQMMSYSRFSVGQFTDADAPSPDASTLQRV
jgi:hypothetical protein